jgi:hypothetical protein
MTLQLADPLYRVSCALALGAFAAAVSQATFYLSVRKRPTGHTEPIIDPEDPAIP